ncbi:hypothetical protein PAXINDRAFT_101109 [Paxillus involutus ATCC 200175]|uniref:Unplaced genomic scaffold PAXINscaffold_38, whole genome shotgun sequence n=1 Tax=Paxillus involutus ATCC 200175 TaxID=664439 RepID=A0A0C9TB00_PAXIN|nr:hypothetical protein PAXINDRAFT_101109 [Paxillus involutus ATCC 200175]
MCQAMKLTLTLLCLVRRFTYLLRLISSRGTSCLRYISAFFRRRALSLFKPLPRSIREDHPSTIARSGGRPSPAPDNEVGSSTQECYILASDAVSPGSPNSASSDPRSGISTAPLLTARISTVGSSFLQVSPTTCASTPATPTQRGTKKLQPSSPEEMNRYKRSAYIHRKTSPKAIPPLKLDYSRPSDHKWKPCTHPEGALYFSLEGDGGGAMTDSNIDDQDTRDLANYFVTKLWRKLRRELDHAKYPAVELVIDISHDEQSVTCKYYFVSHRHLAVFWLSDYIPDCIFYGVEGVEASDHIRLAIETQYWFHCALFPNHIPITKTVVEDLRSTLIHVISDAILSDDSLAPYSVEELQQLLDLVTNIADAERFDHMDGCIMSVVGRLMRIFTQLKFVNFHGQVGARLSADQSLYGEIGKQNERPSSRFVRLIDPILFNAPSSHIKQLHRIWVDHTINLLRWRSFIGTLCNEWNGFTIYSTVLLAVDVSFLAIPEMNGSTMIQTLAAFSIFLSTASAVGSLVASVLLTNEGRGQGLKSADQVVSDMHRLAKTSAGLDALGIMYSLPYGLIMMVFFIIALSLVVFGQGSFTPRIIAVPFWIIIALLASWPAWHKGEELFFWLKPRKITQKKTRTTGSPQLPRWKEPSD